MVVEKGTYPFPQDLLQGNIDPKDKRGGPRRRGWFSLEGGDSPSSSSSSSFSLSLSLPTPQPLPPTQRAHSEFHLIGAKTQPAGRHSTGWEVEGLLQDPDQLVRKVGMTPRGCCGPHSTHTLLIWIFTASRTTHPTLGFIST